MSPLVNFKNGAFNDGADLQGVFLRVKLMTGGVRVSHVTADVKVPAYHRGEPMPLDGLVHQVHIGEAAAQYEGEPVALAIHEGGRHGTIVVALELLNEGRDIIFVVIYSKKTLKFSFLGRYLPKKGCKNTAAHMHSAS